MIPARGSAAPAPPTASGVPCIRQMVRFGQARTPPASVNPPHQVAVSRERLTSRRRRCSIAAAWRIGVKHDSGELASTSRQVEAGRSRPRGTANRQAKRVSYELLAVHRVDGVDSARPPYDTEDGPGRPACAVSLQGAPAGPHRQGNDADRRVPCFYSGQPAAIVGQGLRPDLRRAPPANAALPRLLSPADDAPRPFRQPRTVEGDACMRPLCAGGRPDQGNSDVPAEPPANIRIIDLGQMPNLMPVAVLMCRQRTPRTSDTRRDQGRSCVRCLLAGAARRTASEGEVMRTGGHPSRY
jgi:hypothetical protein